MPRPINPRRIAAPASQFSHGVVHSGRARRLVISGQVGVRIDGTVPDDPAEQMDIAFDNLIAVLTEAGMVRTDLIKITAFCTLPGSVALFRKVRDRKLDGHAPASTYLEVAGLASPAYKVEIEGEAVSEEPDLLFEDMNEEAEIAVWEKK